MAVSEHSDTVNIVATQLQVGDTLASIHSGLVVTEVTMAPDPATGTVDFIARGRNQEAEAIELHMSLVPYACVDIERRTESPDYHSTMIKQLRAINTIGSWQRGPEGMGPSLAREVAHLQVVVRNLMYLVDEQQRSIDKLLRHEHVVSGSGALPRKTTPPLREDG